MRTFTISTSQLESLNRLAKKHGISLEIGQPYIKEVKVNEVTRYERTGFTECQYKVIKELIDVTVNHTMPKSDYTVVAYCKEGLISTFKEDDRIYNLNIKGCAICGTNRNRKNYFILEKNNELIVVGTECAKEALGHDYIEGFLKFHSINEVIGRFIDESIKEDELDYTEIILSFDNILKAKSINKELFVSLFQYDTDYCFNIRKLLETDTVKEKHEKLVLSAIKVYEKHVQDLEANKTIEATDLKPNDKFNIEVEVTSIEKIQTAYGDKWNYKFSNGMEWFTDEQQLNISQTIKLKGTFKEVVEYKGKKKLKVVRCKFEVIK